MAGAGSATVNQITDTIDAHISGGSNVQAAGAIGLSGTDGSSIIGIAGGVAGGGTAAVGAAVGYNLIANTIPSYIDGSTVDSTGSTLTVSSDSAPFLVSMAVGGAGADMLAIGGSVTVNSIANDVDSHISGGSNVSAAGNASVLANEFSEATGDVYRSSLIEIGLALFLVTIVVNALAQLLVWTVTRGQPARGHA